MKKINNYIIEKLKINKDIKINASYFNIGEKILPISLFFVPNEVKTEFVVIEPTEIIEIKDNVITFRDNCWQGKRIKEKIYKNDKGYYEYNEDFSSGCVILNQDDGLDFLNEYANIRNDESTNNIFENLIKKYFDKKDERLFDNKRKVLINNKTTIKKYISILTK